MKSEYIVVDAYCIKFDQALNRAEDIKHPSLIDLPVKFEKYVFVAIIFIIVLDNNLRFVCVYTFQ
jgi:hypothetical protein